MFGFEQNQQFDRSFSWVQERWVQRQAEAKEVAFPGKAHYPSGVQDDDTKVDAVSPG